MSKTLEELRRRLLESADEVESFPHPSHCDHLHVAFKVMREAEAALRELIADAERIEQKTAERCREMALWPQGIDDEQAYYGRMFAEFIEREFKLDAARQSASI